jgi:hypothetical protein
MNFPILQKEIVNFLINIDKVILYMFQSSIKSKKGYTKLFKVLQTTCYQIEKIYCQYFLIPGITN